MVMEIVARLIRESIDKDVLIYNQADKIANLETTIEFLKEECDALRKQLNELL
jgi:cell division protein FtsL